MKRILVTTAVILLGAAVSACGGGGGGGSVVVLPPPAPIRFESQFGANFATDFQKAPNTDPNPIAVGDLIAVNPTAEPVPLPST